MRDRISKAWAALTTPCNCDEQKLLPVPLPEPVHVHWVDDTGKDVVGSAYDFQAVQQGGLALVQAETERIKQLIYSLVLVALFFAFLYWCYQAGKSLAA